jgi:hypothetical protein
LRGTCLAARLFKATPEQDELRGPKVSVFIQYGNGRIYTDESFGCSRPAQWNGTTIFDPLNLSVKWGW